VPTVGDIVSSPAFQVTVRTVAMHTPNVASSLMLRDVQGKSSANMRAMKSLP